MPGIRRLDTALTRRRKLPVTHVVTVMLFTGAFAACDKAPTRPSPLENNPPPLGVPPVVTSISPNTGYAGGPVAVNISGSGFQAGATVTFGGTSAGMTGVTSTEITAVPRPHHAETVDVVVTNPDGQRSTLAGGYTYVLDPNIPRPTLIRVSPNTGSTGGGAYVIVEGTGFRPGMTVTFGGSPRTVGFITAGRSTVVSTLAHEAGPVDVVVTNLDGQAGSLANGYTFVSPETFDLNGEWEGRAGDHWDYALRFTVQDNVVIAVSCDGTAFTFSAPPRIAGGTFSGVENVVRMSGQFSTAQDAMGQISLGVCGNTYWEATKVRASVNAQR